jgi:hypothetical protein
MDTTTQPTARPTPLMLPRRRTPLTARPPEIDPPTPVTDDEQAVTAPETHQA